ncbi:hypothetical protein Fcan01_13827 [Folsomia candida]|uniref:Gustatory receptor n=2 Tax=Folsomia candida TaxID=158441 RepID=A0A226E3R6_FOLCA|nr:hypothetical protein Fcan01_13827 [Folsomia candida]
MANELTPMLLHLKAFTDVGYYTFIIPTKIVITSESEILRNKVFSSYSNFYRKLFCGLIYTIIFCHHCFFPSDIHMAVSHGPLAMVELYRRVLAAIVFIIATTIFWRMEDRFLQIFRIIQGSACILGTNSWWQSARFIGTIITLSYMWFFFIVTPLDLLLDVGVGGEGLHLNVTTALNRLYSRSQRMLFRRPEDVPSVTIDTINFDQSVQSGLYFVLYFFTTWIQTTLEALVLHILFLCCHYVARFEKWYKKLGKEGESDQELVNLILNQYDQVTKLMGTVNALVGPGLVIVMVLYLPFYAVYAGLLTVRKNFTTRTLIVAVLRYGIYLIQMVMGAEIHRNGNEFISWISARFLENISPNRLITFTMDLHTHPIAMKGSGCFTLTYKFMSSIVGVLITYAILVAQFQDGRYRYSEQEVDTTNSTFGG